MGRRDKHGGEVAGSSEGPHEVAERLQAAARHAPIGIALKDAAGRVLWSNRTLQDRLGYADEELRGMFRTEFTHSEDAGEDARLYEELLRGERDNFRLEKRYIRKDGSALWGRLSVFRVGDETDLFLVVVEDVEGRKEAEEELAASERRFRAVIEQAPLCIHVFEPDGRSLRANAAWKELWGLEEPQKTEDSNMYEDQGLRATGLIPYVEQSTKTRALVRTPPLLYDPTRSGGQGRRRWLEASVYPVTDAEGSLSEMVLVVEEVTERKQTEEALAQAEERYRSLVENVPVAAYTQTVGDYTTAAYVSPRIEDLTGYRPEEFDTDPELWYGVVHPDDRQMVAAEDERTERTGEPFAMEYRMVHRDSRILWVRDESVLVRDDTGAPLYWQGVMSDVTDRKSLEDQLKHQALYDPLTGLANRALLEDRLRLALNRTTRRRGEVAVLFVDLDNFKVINDSLGHEAGDRLLVAVSKRLQAAVRPGDTVARLGGDEFIFLLEDIGLEETRGTAERILATSSSPIALEGRQVYVTASIGVAVGGRGTRRTEDLLRNADLAMYRAKHSGKARYAVFEEQMNARALERLELEQDLRRALGRGEFGVYYQPKVSLNGERLVGFEALLRWHHPARGLLRPAEFVPLAEETGLIIPIGEYVLEGVCRRVSAWHKRYPSDPPIIVCVNLSATQFREPDLPRVVARVLEDTGLAPSSLFLEVTESTTMEDAPATVTTFEDLRELGVRAIIDDFGTGYSSLSYLGRFPVDYVKIDGSFVGGLGEDPTATALVKGVVDLAHALELRVIAEGVETEGQLGRLREMGCDLAQGFYFSKPLPGEAVEEWLASRVSPRSGLQGER